MSNRPYAGGSIPENYERHLVPLLFLDYGADLASRISRMDLPSGGTVLETACGTGAVTRFLPGCLSDNRVIVTDLAPTMVEQAQQIVGDRPNFTYQQADATDLPFADDTFDAVICQFSLMLFPDKERGMREAARVLKPGGRFLFNVWDRLEHNGFSQAVHEFVGEMFPNDPPRFLEMPYAYHDLSTMVEALQQTKFGSVEIAVQPRESSASDAHQVAMGLIAGSPLANQVTERGSLEDTVAAVESALAQRFGSGEISAPMQAFQTSARLH
jgi:ubiquinone/menaquinone biosynthesis C-methylase UbiE